MAYGYTPYDNPATEDIDESENWKFLQTIRWDGKGSYYDLPQFTVSGNFGSQRNNWRVVLVQVDLEIHNENGNPQLATEDNPAKLWRNGRLLTDAEILGADSFGVS